MSFLKRMFGGGEDPKARGERLFSEGQLGPAKLAFEQALDRATDATEREMIAERIDECLDALASGHVREAQRFVAMGELDFARHELMSALELAVSDDVRADARRVADGLERGDAVEHAVEEEISDEERWVLLSGAWDEAQAEEYAEYGEDFVQALLAVHAGRHAEGRPKLEAILDEAEAPRYLWLELGRARLVDGDRDGGREALVEFIESLAEDERSMPLLAAYVELARLADEDGEHEEAVGFYEQAIEDFEDDPRPYLLFGHYLRQHELFAEAVDVLEAGAQLLDDMRPDITYMQELGLAFADAGRDEEAIVELERVINVLTSRAQVDFPPEGTERLAQLHEKNGAPERAADLYASLARGSDVQSHFRYHREAGRVLAELGLGEDARRMLTRALALAPDDEAREAVEQRIAALS